MSPAMNMSAVLGQCPRKSDCDRIFKIYMALSVIGSFISACGGTPGYIVLLRSDRLKLKGLILQLPSLMAGYNDARQSLIDFYILIACHYNLLKGVSKHTKILCYVKKMSCFYTLLEEKKLPNCFCSASAYTVVFKAKLLIWTSNMNFGQCSRSIQQDLKSLALGMQTLIVRTLGEYNIRYI